MQIPPPIPCKFLPQFFIGCYTSLSSSLRPQAEIQDQKEQLEKEKLVLELANAEEEAHPPVWRSHLRKPGVKEAFHAWTQSFLYVR